MSIPFWRYVDYTDDGCSVYECLDCYRSWEARTDPKYSGWKFCPYCGCEWEGQREWDSNAKWNRKRGVPLKNNMRLIMSLFVVQNRCVPYDGSEPTEWKSISHGSENFLDAIQTIEFYSTQEATSEPFWSKEEFRIVFDPYKDKYNVHKKISKQLHWTEGDRVLHALKNWEQHKINIKIIKEKFINFTKTG